MAMIGGAIAAAVGLGSVGTFLLTTVAPLAVSIGLNYVSRAIADRRARAQETAVTAPGVQGSLQAGGAVPRSFIHGRWATAGSLVYAGTWGTAGNTPNAYLVQVIALSDLPVSGLAEVWVNGEKVTYNPATTPATAGIPIPQYSSGGVDHLWVKFHDGTQVAANSYLTSKFSGHATRPWTSAAIGAGVAYVIVTARVNQDLFPGFPSFKFVVDGIKLYDIRKDTTAGGSGAHRWATQSTWEFSRNPQVLAYNVIRGLSYGGVWQWGAQGVSAAQLPLSEWSAAATACDTTVAIAGGGTEAQYQAGGEIRFGDQPADVLEELAMACNARLAEAGGIYKPHVGAAGAAAFSFDDGAILSTESQTFVPHRALDENANGIAARYISPAEGWDWKDAPPRIVSAYVAEDAGRRLVAEVAYGRVSSATQVQRLMASALAEARRARRHTLPLPPEAFVLEPNDIVAWTSARNGYDAKLFRVDAVRDRANLDVIVDVTEVDPADYDWDAEIDELPFSDGSIAIERPAAQAILDWAAEGITIPGDDGRAKAGIRLSWDPDVDDVSGVLYEVRLAATEEVVLRGETDSIGAGALDVSHNLVGLTVYEVRGRYRARSARPTSWSDWLEVTTPDVRVDAADLSAQILAEIRLTTNNALGSLNRLRVAVTELIERAAAAAALEAGEAMEHRQEIQQSLVALNGETRALITSLQTVVADADAALASRLDVVEATAAGNSSAIAAEAVARADADSAAASLITAVEALAAQGTASGLIKLEATSTTAGVAARFLVSLNAGSVGSPDWKSAGFYLEILETGIARAFFDVDQFAIGVGSSGAGVAPFLVSGGITYLENVYAKLIQANTIVAGHITAGAITTPKIAEDAVTSIVSASGTTVAAGTNPKISATITRTAGTDLLIWAFIGVPAFERQWSYLATAPNLYATHTLMRGATTLRTFKQTASSIVIQAANPPSVTDWRVQVYGGTFAAVWRDSANIAGAQTYSISTDAAVDGLSLVLMEVKR